MYAVRLLEFHFQVHGLIRFTQQPSVFLSAVGDTLLFGQLALIYQALLFAWLRQPDVIPSSFSGQQAAKSPEHQLNLGVIAMRKITGFVLAAMVMCLAQTVAADEGSTMRAVQVETPDVGAYVGRLKEGNRLIQNIDEKWTITAWQATYAGDSTGTVIVAVIYPGSFATFAAAWEKLTADPAVNAWLAGLSEIRTIVSDSIFMEHPL